MSRREFDIVVVGATGLTGKLVADQIARHAHLLGDYSRAHRWAASGRNRDRTASALAGIAGGPPDVLQADLTDVDALPALTRRASVILNLAGPYTPTAANLIAACVATQTHYVDLSGEIPLLRDVIARYHDAAAAAGIKIVQMAGWDALPADLTTLLASRRAIGVTCVEGPGAGGMVEAVLVTGRFLRTPEGRVPLSQAVSAGTLSSIVEMLQGPEARLIGQTGALLPPVGRSTVLPPGLRLRPLRTRGRVLAPFVPIPFLNPPIVHRTAALRAAENGVAYHPARYREGDDIGSGIGVRAIPAFAKAWLWTGVQRAVIGIAHAPAPIRQPIANALRRRVPEPGSGPGGRFQTDWDWTVHAAVRTGDGRTGEATMAGCGHPGYAATSAMIAEVGFRIALGRVPDRYGCLTPALALGSLDLDPWFIDSLRLR